MQEALLLSMATAESLLLLKRHLHASPLTPNSRYLRHQHGFVSSSGSSHSFPRQSEAGKSPDLQMLELPHGRHRRLKVQASAVAITALTDAWRVA